MKPIKVALLDDEVSNIQILKNILENQCENVEIVWTADNLDDARKNIRSKEIDVIFMDIEMPPHSSFELLETIDEPKFEIIFVTAYQEYALRALKMAALDYILKPIKASDIVQVIDKLRTTKKNKYGELTGLIKNYLSGNMNENFSKIVVHVADGYDIVDINNIIFIEALDSYTKLKLINNVSYVASRSLKDFEELLSEKGFYRVHKSYLINLRHMVKIVKGVSASVVMSNGVQVPVSARKKDVFFAELKGVIAF
ncbi:MAG: LytR/AlgR family response regulator transcription factor [Ilyomonas sp.]